MKVENSVIPTQEQMEGFMTPGPDGPISMVNLLKFKEKAVYKDGRETELTGQEAYALYSRGVCLLYTSPSPRDLSTSRMPSSA